MSTSRYTDSRSTSTRSTPSRSPRVARRFWSSSSCRSTPRSCGGTRAARLDAHGRERLAALRVLALLRQRGRVRLRDVEEASPRRAPPSAPCPPRARGGCCRRGGRAPPRRSRGGAPCRCGSAPPPRRGARASASTPSRGTSRPATSAGSGTRRRTTPDPGADRRQQVGLARRAEDPDGPLGRLLERLQQHVRGALGHPVRVLDDHHAVVRDGRRVLGGGDEPAHLVDRDRDPVGREHREVRMGAGVDLRADPRRRRSSARGQQRGRERVGEVRPAGSGRSGDQPRVRHHADAAVRAVRVAGGGGDRLDRGGLADQLGVGVGVGHRSSSGSTAARIAGGDLVRRAGRRRRRRSGRVRRRRARGTRSRTRAWKSSCSDSRRSSAARPPRRCRATARIEVEQDREVRQQALGRPGRQAADLLRVEHPPRALVGDGGVEVAVLHDDVAALERRPHHGGDVVGAVRRVEQRLRARGRRDRRAARGRGSPRRARCRPARGCARPCVPRSASQRSRAIACVVLPAASPPSSVRNTPRPSCVARFVVVVRFAGVRPRGRLLLRRGPLGALVREQLLGALEVDRLDLLAARDRRVRLAVGDVRAEAAVLDPDRLAAHRVGVELLQRGRGATGAVLRLREQLERPGQVDGEDAVLVGQRAGVRPLLQVRARTGRSAR